MAYFLPSYFQKRLLRYALLRLDFIETDALDLENLGISFGQRSVIELKNVGIKVSKVVETLQLPPTLVLNHASIRNLRLTIPADLHASSIVVEVDGIIVQADLGGRNLQEHDTSSKPSRRVPLNRDDASNRPRIPSPAVHDPGGARKRAGKPNSEIGHVIPTSQDLAMSFLEAEPLQEKQELQAAIQSQSVHLQQSTASLDASVDESGLGMPGGFSLPSFVASFFSGIADRLTVKIKNVEVMISMQLNEDTTAPEIVKTLIKLEDISLASITPDTHNLDGLEGQRVVSLAGFEIQLLSEAEAFSQHSATSSPKLAKSRSKLSSMSSESQTSPQLGRATGLQDSSHSIRRSLSSSFESKASSDLGHSGLGIVDSMLESSQVFHRPITSPNSSSDESVQARHIDNRLHAEQVAAAGRDIWPSSQSQTSRGSSNEELAESKVFTHDEAESMYMSAVSTALETEAVMPGAWGSPEATFARGPGMSLLQRANESITRQSPDVVSQNPAVCSAPINQELTEQASPASLQSSGINKISPVDSSDSNFVAKRLVFIDRIKITIPASSHTTEIEEVLSLPRQSSSSTYLPNSTPDWQNRKPQGTSHSQATSLSRIISSPTTYGKAQAAVVIPESEQPLLVDIGEVIFSLDMSISYILVRSASIAARLLPSSNTSDRAAQKPVSKFFARSTISNLVCNVYQKVSEVPQSHSLLRSPFQEKVEVHDESPLLQLSLTKIKHEIATTTSSTDQRLSIHKILMGRSSEQMISFFDPSNTQDSFVVSSMIVEPDDMVIRSSNDRVDISVKPAHIVLDLLLMDDVLSRSGGLSSLLDLGSSIASTGTIKEVQSKSKTEPRQRSVRFDSPTANSRSEDGADRSGKKINARISGVIIDLVGSECSVRVKSSAVKTVLRDSRLALQISSVSVQGPLLVNTKSSSDIKIKVTDINLRYFSTPEEQDLDRLLSILTPSSDMYDQEDDIMVDTLLRQRRKGGVIRFSTQDLQVAANGLEWLSPLVKLGDELSKLSSVTKYLPEDDRPGILSFVMINKLQARVNIDESFGSVTLKSQLIEGAHISIPALMAAQASSFTLMRGESDKILGEVIPETQDTTVMGPPMLMCRFIADEMEPTVKLKISNTALEYKVPTIVALTELLQSLKSKDDKEKSLLSPQSSEMSSRDSETSDFTRKVRLSLAMRNSAISLNPDSCPAKGLFLLTDATLSYSNKQHGSIATLDLRKASILIIDDVSKIGNEATNVDHKLYFDQNDQVQELTRMGYVPVGSISAAFAEVKITGDEKTHEQFLDVEFRNNLFFLETCADSTQTLFQIIGGLAPPSPPSKEAKYRTEIVPIQDMLASFTGNAFVSEAGPELGLQASQESVATTASASNTVISAVAKDQDDEDDDEDDGSIEDLYASRTEEADDMELADSYLESEGSQSFVQDSIHIAPVNVTADDQSNMDQSIMAHSLLDFRTDHFVHKTSIGGTAHRWDSTRNTYGLGSEASIRQSPLKLRVRDVHIIWNLFDGYDWQNTRDTISQAVQDIETKAMSRHNRRDSRRSPGIEDDEESVIGDVLFNSIYISIPAHKDPKDLTSAINQDIGDMASETGSYATSTTITATSNKRQSGGRPKTRRLRLNRSKQHKMTFELEGLSADFLMFPPNSGEVESSMDVRVRKLEVFDHVPTSTWKKFATYMQEAGEREVGTDMVHIELLNVKPVAELTASEVVLKITVLPLRLHVDQDALDFMTRFFEFKDDRIPASTTPSAPLFLQRVEVNPIRLRLDFKPKRVDYAGLRSGRTTEFMNFFILDRADMVLRRVILYGVSGLERLGIMLNSIWTPDVKKNQLPGVLAGLAPIRSLVDVGSGVKDLIAVPIQEYRKDGRIVRSIQKGALAFAKTTTTELVNLGAKLAIGTQTVLQNTEELLVSGSQAEDDDEDEETKKQISLYADQPLGIVQGLRGAYASLERDLLLAKDAIVAVPGEVMATGSATGAAKAVLKQSPTIILRPAIGVTKAMGQAFLGAGNTLDKTNRKRIEDKYKRY